MRSRAAFVLFLLVARLTGAATSPVAAEAERVRANARDTSYQHRTEIDDAAGVYRLDCSAFAGYVVHRSAPAAFRELESWVASLPQVPRRPLAKHFVGFFDSLSGDQRDWAPVLRARDLRAGDLLAWLKPAEVESTNTGHVMVVAARAVETPERPGEWLVRVFDSSASGHGTGDPRRKSGPNGVGRGTIGLRVDDEGRPTAYRWSGLDGGRAYRTKIRAARVRD